MKSEQRHQSVFKESDTADQQAHLHSHVCTRVCLLAHVYTRVCLLAHVCTRVCLLAHGVDTLSVCSAYKGLTLEPSVFAGVRDQV